MADDKSNAIQISLLQRWTATFADAVRSMVKKNGKMRMRNGIAIGIVIAPMRMMFCSWDVIIFFSLRLRGDFVLREGRNTGSFLLELEFSFPETWSLSINQQQKEKVKIIKRATLDIIDSTHHFYPKKKKSLRSQTFFQQKFKRYQQKSELFMSILWWSCNVIRSLLFFAILNIILVSGSN